MSLALGAGLGLGAGVTGGGGGGPTSIDFGSGAWGDFGVGGGEFVTASAWPTFSAPVTALGGQSNAAGQGSDSTGFVFDTSHVNYFLDSVNVAFDAAHAITGTFGPDLTMGNTIAAAATGGTIVLSKHAIGGTALSRWLPANADLWPGLASAIDAAKALGTRGAFVWFQGEADANDGAMTAATYKSQLDTLAAAVRAQFGYTTRIFIVELNYAFVGAFSVSGLEVRRGQEQFVAADGNAEIVNFDDMVPSLGITHYGGNQPLSLGRRIGAQIVAAFR